MTNIEGLQEDCDKWRLLALRLARHIRNTDDLPLCTWGTKGVDLLNEVRQMDPATYDSYVKPTGAPPIAVPEPISTEVDSVRLTPGRTVDVCKKRGWSLHWTARGAYLHLESSELIEALRGKHGDPTKEAGDVLIVLTSITENAGIQWEDVVQAANEKLTDLETKPRYKGEAVESDEPRHSPEKLDKLAEMVRKNRGPQ